MTMDAARPLSGLRVLLAEDHFAIALAMSGMLEDLGCVVVAEAGDTAAATEAARTVAADCALLDIDMGDGTGYAAAEHCRARGIPVIFTTGYDLPPDMPADLADLPRLVKPVAAVDLKRVLRGLAAAG